MPQRRERTPHSHEELEADSTMDTRKSNSTSLFDVYLRLRPQLGPQTKRFLDLDEATEGQPTHITIKPPTSDHRKRAIEKFAFTSVFDDTASQKDVFSGTSLLPMLEGVLAPERRGGKDGLLATLGVTGSGKTHTILGSKSQRGLTQMTLDVLFKSIRTSLVRSHLALNQLAATDVSEATIVSASSFLESMYGDCESRAVSRAQTPMLESNWTTYSPNPVSKRHLPRPSALPICPSIDDIRLAADQDTEYAIVVSMYEVYNDRIYDLLTGTATTAKAFGKDARRRALLFKSTEHSPDQKVVAGLKKIVCGTLDEALLVLETGLTERRVAGTGSNAVSSRSHGFFCVEVKKRNKTELQSWIGNTLTIVDLAGSERARTAKTAGATLAEAGKINESLMYLGQCMQMQSDNSLSNSGDTHLVPFRQCKLTELLFSNTLSRNAHRAQKGLMIVTADPRGDFNATSQILRYSALAREVTVPRIPSVTSTILQPSQSHHQREPSGGRISPTGEEVARLTAELELLRHRLDDETSRRRAAEESWAAASTSIETAVEAAEAAVRAECMDAFDDRLAAERTRFVAAADAERAAGERLWDGKVGILSRAVGGTDFEVWEEGSAERCTALEAENDALRERVASLEGECRRLQNQPVARTPSRKIKVLTAKKWVPDEGEGEGRSLTAYGDENVTP